MKCYNITYFRLSQVLRWSKVSAEFGAASTGAQVLPQNKCCSRGTMAPSRHGGRRPIIHGFRQFRTTSHGWSGWTNHDVGKRMRPRQRFGYFAAGPKSRPSAISFILSRIRGTRCSRSAAADRLDKAPQPRPAGSRKNPRTLPEKADAGLIGGLRFRSKQFPEFSE